MSLTTLPFQPHGMASLSGLFLSNGEVYFFLFLFPNRPRAHLVVRRVHRVPSSPLWKVEYQRLEHLLKDEESPKVKAAACNKTKQNKTKQTKPPKKK
jgi:hypothetical protein